MQIKQMNTVVTYSFDVFTVIRKKKLHEGECNS
jgi:hypothetical protein